MAEEIIQTIKRAMMPDLTDAQLERLENVLCITLHGKKITEEHNELASTGEDGDVAKINMFLGSKKTTGRADGTLQQYSREIYNMLDFLGKRLEDITAMDLRYYYAVMRERRGIQMSTMQTRIHYLSSFWDFLTLEKLVPDNPVRRIGGLKVETTVKKPFGPEELEALRLHCDRSRDRALVEFLLATGLRVSELCKLNVEDIDFYRMEFYGRGMPVEQLMVLMGHSKIETTMIYVTVKTSSVREAYRRLRAG